MARKADEDLLAELDQLGSEDQPAAATPSGKSKKDPSTAGAKDDEEDAFAEIEKQLAAKPAGTSSRPGTPRLNSSTTSATTTTTNKSPRRADLTPSAGSSSERNSSDATAQVRSSGEGSRSFHQGISAEADKTEEAPKSSGGWWGSSLLSAASAAVKQAESLAKEIRGNEEAQKWAEQMRGNMRGLQEFGTDLRSRALPTFTSLISHIAPPISAHERLQIHTTHDIQNYPSLDPLIYAPFARIMAQVEGGDLLVLQRGSEARIRSNSGNEEHGYRGRMLGGASSWTDGPWWREQGVTRSLSAVPGLKEGSRLARVSAEAYAKEFFDARGGVEAAAKRATESLSETNPVRSSDIFLSIQAVQYGVEKDLFAASAAAEEADAKKSGAESDDDDQVVVFAIYLHDPIHGLSFRTLSQSFPARWAAWLDSEAGLPESIREIIHAGGVDPRDWIAEWMEEILSLAVGIVAQGYVAKRMGVGEGSIGQAKQPVESEASAGEAARAV